MEQCADYPDIGGPGDRVDVNKLRRNLACLRRMIVGILEAPVVVAEATPAASSIFSAPKNLLSSGLNPVDTAGVSWIYLDRSTAGSLGLHGTNADDSAFRLWMYGGGGGGGDYVELTTWGGPAYIQPYANASPTPTRARIELRGNDTRAGFSTDYTAWQIDGLQSMAGTARPSKWITLGYPDLGWVGAGGPAPGLRGGALIWSFDPNADASTFHGLHLPADYAAGTDIQLYYEWNPSSTNANTVTWGVRWYILTAETGDLLTDATTTQIVLDDAQGSTGLLQRAPVITISGAGAAAGDWLSLFVFRDANASEAGADDDYTGAAELVSVRVGYIADRLGADERW